MEAHSNINGKINSLQKINPYIMRIFLTAIFFLIFVFIIHMIVFVASGKSVADNLGFFGVLAHGFGSLYLARLVAKKTTEAKKLPSGQLLSVAKARAKAMDEAIERGDIKESDLHDMMAKLQNEKQKRENKSQ